MATAKKTKATQTVTAETPVETPVEVPVKAPAEEPKIIPKDIDQSQYIPVRNGFQGTLVYVSKRTGETFVWDKFGAEQDIELKELKNIKSSDKAFYENNWFMFDDAYKWVIDYLGLRQYYKHALDVDQFDDIFTLPPDELRTKLNALSDGAKGSVMYRASELIHNGEIDSIKTIRVLEDVLGVELVEK